MPIEIADSNKRIAKNTLYLYIRMLVTIVVSLYTSRVVLQVLGASDYGLYCVVAGVLSMFSMFSGALTVGTQRFLNFAMGEGNEDKLKKTFSIAFSLHLYVAIALFVVGQTIGYCFVVNYLNIPDGRMTAAIWVYELSLISLVVTVLQIPFQSCIIAHEDMNMYAKMSIYDVVMKLVVILLIQYVTFDKLIIYSILVFLVYLSSVLIYNFYCRHHYAECTFKLDHNNKLMKEIATYSGWNILGGSIGPITNQAVNILLNIFCGTIVNAARGLSITVNTYIVQFVSNFQMAANPQIVKLYAAGEYEKFYNLLINNSRVAAYLFLLIAIPAYIEIDFVLRSWLGEYPAYTSIFTQVILIQSFFQSVNRPINMSVHASGKIKWMNISNTVFMVIVLPACYMVLKMGYSPVAVYWINVVFFLTDNIVCLYFSHKYTQLSISTILHKVYLNTTIGAVVMFIIPYLVYLHMDAGLARFITVCFISVITSAVVFYFWGMTPGMKALVQDRIRILYPHKTDRSE